MVVHLALPDGREGIARWDPIHSIVAWDENRLIRIGEQQRGRLHSEGPQL